MKFRIATCFWIGPLVIGLLATGTILAGNLDPVGDPTDTNTAMFSLRDIYNRLDSGASGAKRTGGFVDPTNAPVPTGHTLNEIMAKTPATNALAALAGNVLTGKVFWGLSSGAWGQQIGTIPSTNLLPNSAALAAGYYTATNLTQVDADLVSSNIATNVTIFGVAGTLNASTFPAPVARTGQVSTNATGDDGYYHKGVEWPEPRFAVGTGASSNCVVDNLTGLMWAKMPDSTPQSWANAITRCEGWGETSGYLGTNGWGGYTDWRLPNIKEWQSLIDYSRVSPALQPGVFTNMTAAQIFWTSTASGGNRWAQSIQYGLMIRDSTSGSYSVLPVRGGR